MGFTVKNITSMPEFKFESYLIIKGGILCLPKEKQVII